MLRAGVLSAQTNAFVHNAFKREDRAVIHDLIRKNGYGLDEFVMLRTSFKNDAVWQPDCDIVMFRPDKLVHIKSPLAGRDNLLTGRYESSLRLTAQALGIPVMLRASDPHVGNKSALREEKFGKFRDVPDEIAVNPDHFEVQHQSPNAIYMKGKYRLDHDEYGQIILADGAASFESLKLMYPERRFVQDACMDITF